MKRMLITIQYDGTAYHGWQIQPNAITVQEVIENSLFKLLNKKTAVTGCSRTDAGVHAKNFCFHIDCDDGIPYDAFLKGLNSLLPNDICVTGCMEVSNDFHARYSAIGKTYSYYILNSNIPDAFLSRYSWQIERELNVSLMNEFCKTIRGTHDFYAFSSSGRTVENTIRTISECNVKKENDKIILSVTGNGFLYNMVRIIVGTAVDISDGRIKLENIPHILKMKDRASAGTTAPAQGLFLEKVYYNL